MIVGMGIDIVEVADLERRLDDGFVLKVFSEGERADADSRPDRRAEILAGRWAAKEAFAKALGTGLRAEWPLNEIEVRRGETGRPVIRLGPSLQHLAPPTARIHCSISHTAAFAAAVVVIEGE